MSPAYKSSQKAKCTLMTNNDNTGSPTPMIYVNTTNCAVRVLFENAKLAK